MKLRSQIITLLCFCGLLPLCLVFSYIIWNNYQLANQQILKAAELRLEQAATELAAYFHLRESEIALLAQHSLVKSMDFKAMRPLLIEILELKKPHYEKFIIGQPDGTFYNTAGGNPYQNLLRTFDDNAKEAIPKTIQNRDYWQYTVGNNQLNQQRRYISNPMISYTTEVKQIVVAASVHKKTGATAGLIGGALPWNNIHNILNQIKISIEREFSGQVQLALLSNNGVYWYHWDRDKIIHLAKDENGNYITGDNGEKITVSTHLMDSNNSQLLNAADDILQNETTRLSIEENQQLVHHLFKKVPSTGFVLQLVVPNHVLFASTKKLTIILLLIFSSAVLVAMILTVALSKRMVLPLTQLTSAVKKIHQNKLTPIQIDSNTLEFSQLLNTFNQMIHTVNQRETLLKASEERFALAMQGANDGLWDWNLLTNEVYFSPRWKQMLGYKDSELENHLNTWKQLIHPADIDATEQALSDYIEGKAPCYHQEFRMKHRNGRLVTILARGFLIRDEQTHKPLRMVGTHVDISAQKHRETKLKLLNAQLENRVTEHVSSLQALDQKLIQAKQFADMANQSKNRFIANMSHKIKTDMNGIIGLTALCLRTQLTTQQHNYLTKLAHSADTLLHIVNNILDFSKTEAGKLKLEEVRFNLTQEITITVDPFKIQAEEKNIKLITNIDKEVAVNVIGDPKRLAQVLSNLISNALTFTKHGSVTLQVTNSKQDDYIQFSVIDTGIGISKTQQHALFGSFVQANNATSANYGVTGIGLSLCQSLIQLMKGEIQLTSTPGVGSEFSFTVYLPEDITNNKLPVSPASSSSLYIHSILTGKKVLLVEDEKINQLIEKELLEQSGITVEIANNGEEAVSLAADNDYDVILMDIQMPHMDGYEATKQIRKIQRHKKTLIIAMTATAIDDNKQHYRDIGINGHIAKPIEPEQLLTTLTDQFNSNRG